MDISKLEVTVQVCAPGKPTRSAFRRVFNEKLLLKNQSILEGETILI
jgi:hypothetical protein